MPSTKRLDYLKRVRDGRGYLYKYFNGKALYYRAKYAKRTQVAFVCLDSGTSYEIPVHKQQKVALRSDLAINTLKERYGITITKRF